MKFIISLTIIAAALSASAQRPPPYEPPGGAFAELSRAVQQLQTTVSGQQSEIRLLQQENAGQRARIQSLTQEVQTLQQSNAQLAERVRRLENRPPVVPQPPPYSPPTPQPPPYNPPAPQPPPYVPPAPMDPVYSDSLVDVILPHTGTCLFASIRQNSSLKATLVWKDSTVAALRAGSEIVQIISPVIFTWADYPSEHAIRVKVVKSYTQPSLVGLEGYIEIDHIAHKACNIGAEYNQ